MRNRKHSGFTMAEMLIVVAIMIVLMGLIFVSVTARQRSMTRLEFDAIAKEIFIAAQNHLTEAKGQDYLGLSKKDGDFGTEVSVTDATGKKEIFYVTSSDGAKILSQMLPGYALDASALSGTYVIVYQRDPAQILEVFYSLPGKSSFLTVSGTNISGDYADLTAASPGYREGQEANREKYPKGGKNYVIGWYGGGEALPKGERLDVPALEINNAEQLYVKLSDLSKYEGYSLILVVEGKSSKAEKYFPITTGASVSETSVLLDDVTTAGNHFAQIFKTADKTVGQQGFIPGEDLNIYAVAFSVDSLTNVAKSPVLTTNSLFADPDLNTNYSVSGGTEYSVIGGTSIVAPNSDNNVVGIANFRHLENLEEDISGTISDERIKIAKAAQISDLDWTAGWRDWEDNSTSWSTSKIFALDGSSTSTGCYYPVSPSAALEYLGNPPVKSDDPSAREMGRAIKNVKVDFSGPAGLFGTLSSGSEVRDLILVNFNVTGGTSAGALAGETSGNVTITNVVAHNDSSRVFQPGETEAATVSITASGSAGGLIGSMSGGSMDNCAGALIVRSSGGSAGGLIGATDGTTVMSSFSGGHTKDGAYQTDVYNVTGTISGGLIGSMSGGSVSNCYSTCSASGTTAAGGLIGSASGTVNNSYATGLVSCMGTNGNEGRTLIGSGSASTSGNRYLGSVNGGLYVDKTNPDDNVAGDANAVSFSSSATEIATFYASSPTPADPYDRPGLTQSYEGQYPYVRWLNGIVSASSFVGAFHYGDWPMETLLVNQK